MLALPVEVAAVAKAANRKDNSPRYSVNGVWLEHKDGKWAAAATDLKRLIVAEGTTPDDWPVPAVLEQAPNGAASALIPTDSWTAAFAAAKKLTAKCKSAELKRCGVVLNEKVVTFAGNNLERVESSAAGPLEGKFPLWRQIIPKSPPHATVPVDAVMLAEVLKAVAEMTAPESHGRVTLELRGKEKPIIVRADYPSAGVALAWGLVMPMGDREGNGPADRTERHEPGDSPEVKVARSVLDAYERDAVEMTSKNADLARKLVNAEDAVAGLERHIRELQKLRHIPAPVQERTTDEWVAGLELVVRDAKAESQRLWDENQQLRAELESLRGGIPTALTTATRPRRTLGQLAAGRTGGA